MKRNPVQYDPAMKNGYIRPPYELEEGDRINAQVLEPVLFRNENGPTIGVTTCGVIVQDGLFFKDMDNDGVLSPSDIVNAYGMPDIAKMRDEYRKAHPPQDTPTTHVDHWQDAARLAIEKMRFL